MTRSEDEFVNTIKQVLDESLEDIDDADRKKLVQSRRQALFSRRKKHRSPEWRTVFLPLPAIAALVWLVVMRPGTDLPIKPVDMLPDLHLLATEDTLGFFSEEIAFYQWLSEVNNEQEDLFDDRRSDDVDFSDDRSV